MLIDRLIVALNNRPLERVRDQMREDENHAFSECNSGSYSRLLLSFGIIARRFNWDMNAIRVTRQYILNPYNWIAGVDEVHSYPSICVYLHQNLQSYVFEIAGFVKLRIDYVTNGHDQYKEGRGDIFAFPRGFDANRDFLAMRLETICAIEIKVPLAISTAAPFERAIRQIGLQIISLLFYGNNNHPFGLLTDMIDKWIFVWIEMGGTLRFFECISRERGNKCLSLSHIEL